jgi:hypothetical protein
VLDAADRAKIVLPVVGGISAPIVQIAADGVARMGSATVTLSAQAGRLLTTVSNIRMPQ